MLRTAQTYKADFGGSCCCLSKGQSIGHSEKFRNPLLSHPLSRLALQAKCAEKLFGLFLHLFLHLLEHIVTHDALHHRCLHFHERLHVFSK